MPGAVQPCTTFTAEPQVRSAPATTSRVTNTGPA